MSSLGELWDSLCRVGLEALAPNLVRHSVTSINQLVLKAEELHKAGLLCWQLVEAILASASSLAAGPAEEQPEPSRPSEINGQPAGLEAAKPNQKQKSLQALDRDVLARSTITQPWRPGFGHT